LIIVLSNQSFKKDYFHVGHSAVFLKELDYIFVGTVNSLHLQILIADFFTENLYTSIHNIPIGVQFNVEIME